MPDKIRLATKNDLANITAASIGAATVEYVDSQVSSITETGIPKLNVYPLAVVSTQENQTVFNINLDTFDANTDTVLVQSGRTMLFPNEDFTVVGNTVVLNEGVPTDWTIGIYVFKNVPMGQEGSVSGAVIADGSIPLSALAEEVLSLTGGTLEDSLYLEKPNGDMKLEISTAEDTKTGYFNVSNGDDHAHVLINPTEKWIRFVTSDDNKATWTGYNLYGEHNPPACNNNILINSNFANPVNQRGYVSGTTLTKNEFTIDRWEGMTGQIITLSSQGLTIESTADTNNGYSWFGQSIENDDFFRGKTFSISAKINGEIFSTTFTSSIDGPASGTNITIKDGDTVKAWIYFEYVSDKNCYNLTFQLSKGFPITIEWVKLELGDHATPYVPRLYAEELALCRRYFQRIEIPAYRGSQIGSVEGNSQFKISYHTIPMRIQNTTATIKCDGNLKTVYSDGTSSEAYTVASISSVEALSIGSIVYLNLRGISANTKWLPGRLITDSDKPCVIDISAEL